ncbi:major capsid protein [Pseudomonas koreensis]|uniref:major capsid protein n=1 Tax=Pseudomonas koreensis TaxID=198620 RepID=UPI00320921FB
MKAAISNTLKTAVGIGATVGAAASQAAIDTAPITASLTEAGAAVAVIGAAVLGVVVVVKTFKYIRGAF